MGSAVQKQFLHLGEAPILVHTLRALEACPEIDAIILVVPEQEKRFCREEIVKAHGLIKVTSVIAGGKERRDSVHAGLKAVSVPPETVVIHDGVRPFVTCRMVRETLVFARQGVGAVVGVPLHDTVKSVDGDKRVIETLRRDQLWSIQTPQAFPYSLLLEAYEEAHKNNYTATDDASLVERMGIPVHIVPGSLENIKITRPQDLLFGEAILNEREKNAHRAGI
jgi:2-C-methyl-D-erythritol 4-phosphate cytidylyltransferase